MKPHRRVEQGHVIFGASRHVHLVIPGARSADDNKISSPILEYMASNPRPQHNEAVEINDVIRGHLKRIEPLVIVRIANSRRLIGEESIVNMRRGIEQ